MKKILLLAALTTSLFACSSSKTGETSGREKFDLDTTKLVSGAEFYQCPMHHEVLSKRPGDCPTCGMPLEKVLKK